MSCSLIGSPGARAGPAGSMRRLRRIPPGGAWSSCWLIAHPRARRPGLPGRRSWNVAVSSPLVGVLVHDLGVDHVVVRGRRATGRTVAAGRTAEAGRTAIATRGAVGLGLRVQRATDLLGDPGDLLLRRLDRGDVGAAQRGAQLGER